MTQTPDPHPSPTGSIASSLLPWLLPLATFFALTDQVTKLWVLRAVPADFYWNRDGTAAGIEIIPGFLYLVHIHNPGAAWGIMSGMSFWLALLGIIAVIVIIACHRHLELHRPFHQVIFGLLIGGIIGNVIDRLRTGKVVDFIDVRLWTDFRWPAFNVADSCITVGVVLYLIATLRASPGKK